MVPISCPNIVEDEIHVMFYCPVYEQLRHSMLMHAIELCNGLTVSFDARKIGFLTSHVNIIRKTAKFLTNMMSLKKQILRV